MKKFKLQISYKDERGEIIDLLSKEKINAVTYISFKKGAIRGNHLHKKTTQWTYVISGKLLIKSKKRGKKISEIIISRGGFMVDEKDESHAMLAKENSEIIVFTKGPRGGKEYESDTYRLKKPLISP